MRPPLCAICAHDCPLCVVARFDEGSMVMGNASKPITVVVEYVRIQ